LTIKGNLTCAGDIQIDGHVEGDVASHSVTIGEGADVCGTIAAETVRICGIVHGEIKAATVVLEKTAKVTGNIMHRTCRSRRALVSRDSVAARTAHQRATVSGRPPRARSRGDDNAGPHIECGRPGPAAALVGFTLAVGFSVGGLNLLGVALASVAAVMAAVIITCSAVGMRDSDSLCPRHASWNTIASPGSRIADRHDATTAVAADAGGQEVAVSNIGSPPPAAPSA
jgi:hypothetical protein